MLVSCIMPTRGRQAFISEAITCYLAQDYRDRELIVVEDGPDNIRDLLPAGATYLRHAGSIGAKRNKACEIARGDVICHWDDDDWYGPKRITEQVRILKQSCRPATGYHVLPFAWDAGRRAWEFRREQGYACGTSLCYLKASWKTNRFPDVQIGEDNRFIEGLRGRLISDAGASIVARMHASSTCGNRLAGLINGSGLGGNWREIPYAALLDRGYQEHKTDEIYGTEEHAEPDRAHDGADHKPTVRRRRRHAKVAGDRDHAGASVSRHRGAFPDARRE